MNLDLCTIDWTAIGSIATVIAMIIAYRTIYISVKQNKDNQKFQTLLVQREIEQKRLDELVENIMIINDSIQPIIVNDYSVKLTNGIFTEDDRHFIDGMAAKDCSDSNRLRIQLMKYDKEEAVKDVLIALRNLRFKYGEWVRILSNLYTFKTNRLYLKPELEKMISTMKKTIVEINPKMEENTNQILSLKIGDLDKAINLMSTYSYMINKYILDNQKVFEKELLTFVKKEQSRIDNIFSHKSIK